MISNIAQFYKLSLSGVADRVSISEELAQLDYYLKIQACATRAALGMTSRPPEILSCEIFKFTLQPLVENAIYHGVKPN
jgi:two-component system sensor histidine kinase YesM